MAQNDDMDWFDIAISVSSSTSSLRTRLASREAGRRQQLAIGRDKAKAMWVPPDVPVTVAGFQITGGMVYVGSGLASVGSEWSVEPALIDPKLPVAKRSGTGSQYDALPYWSAYDQVNPSTRRKYLRWLADGRRDPGASMPLVWMFFYGLERRLLDDHVDVWSAEPEVEVLAQEIRELAAVYGRDSNFHGHATRLLNVIDSARGRIEPWDDSSMDWDLPIGLRIELGRHAAAGTPLTAELALQWAIHHPEIYLRTPAQRCRAQFEELFRLLYDKRSKPITPSGSGEIRLTYYPATSSMYNVADITLDGTVDVAADGRARGALKRLVTRATEGLDAYSRWMGREHDARDSLAALSIYPEGVTFDEHVAGYVTAFETDVASAASLEDPRGVSAETLLAHFPVRSAGKPTAKELQTIADALARIGIGIIPDPGTGDRWDTGLEPILYALAERPRRSQGDAEAAGQIAGAIGALVGQLIQAAPAVGAHLLLAMETELRHVGRAAIRSLPEVTARALFHSQRKLTPARLRKVVEAIGEQRREQVVVALVRIAAQAGAVDPQSIHRLDDIGAACGAAPEQVHRMLHSASGGTLNPPAWRDKKITSTSRGSGSDPERHIDETAANRLMRDSRKLTAQLHAILNSDDAEEIPAAESTSPPSSEPTTQKAAHTGGLLLDAAHLRIVESFLDRDQISRSEFEQLANSGDLFPDAALEAINEAVLDLVGDILFDGDDPIAVVADVAQELKSRT